MILIHVAYKWLYENSVFFEIMFFYIDSQREVIQVECDFFLINIYKGKKRLIFKIMTWKYTPCLDEKNDQTILNELGKT